MILRGFSRDGANVSLLVLKSGKVISSAPISRHCYEPYFYGKEPALEDSFAAEEARVAAILGDRSPATLRAVSDGDLDVLRLFTHYQYARTVGAARSATEGIASFVKSTVQSTAQLNTALDSSAFEGIEIGVPDMQDERIWHACKSTPLVSDLAVKFITTARTPGFVVADHPVVAYNQFVEHHAILSGFPGGTGLAEKGLQLFMPLSSDVVLALFDPKVYSYGGTSIVCRAGPNDVSFLNGMQAVNAWETLAFDDSRMSPAGIGGMLQTRQSHPSAYAKTTWKSDFVQKPDGTISQIVAVTGTPIRVGAKLSFVRVLDGRSYTDHHGATVPVRSQDLVRFTELYGKHLEAMVNEQRELGAGTDEE